MGQKMKMPGSKRTTQSNKALRKNMKFQMQDRKCINQNDFHRFPKHLKAVA